MRYATCQSHCPDYFIVSSHRGPHAVGTGFTDTSLLFVLTPGLPTCRSVVPPPLYHSLYLYPFPFLRRVSGPHRSVFPRRTYFFSMFLSLMLLAFSVYASWAQAEVEQGSPPPPTSALNMTANQTYERMAITPTPLPSFVTQTAPPQGLVPGTYEVTIQKLGAVQNDPSQPDTEMDGTSPPAPASHGQGAARTHTHPHGVPSVVPSFPPVPSPPDPPDRYVSYATTILIIGTSILYGRYPHIFHGGLYRIFNSIYCFFSGGQRVQQPSPPPPLTAMHTYEKKRKQSVFYPPPRCLVHIITPTQLTLPH